MASAHSLATRLRDGTSARSRSRTPDVAGLRSTPPKGNGQRNSLSPSPDAKRAMLKRKAVSDNQSPNGYVVREADGTPPMKKLALAS
jgi:pre-mRNA cleavage complex 2 protein Pcf11